MNALARMLDERSPRERFILAIVGAVVAATLLVAFVWLPLERSRARLAAELPALRASIGVMQGEAEEAGRLRSMPLAAKESAVPLESIAGARPLAGAQVSIVDKNTVSVTGNDVAFGSLIEWLAAVQAAQGLRVDSARIEALPASGRVRADLRLSRT